MKITKRQLRRIIFESIDSEPFDITSNTPGVGESIGYDYTVTERRPSLFQGIGGQPMERVAFTYRISPGDDTIVYSDFPAVPKGMPLKDFFEAGLNRGFPDMYPPIPPQNAATGTAKGMPRVGEPIKEGRVKITKRQLRRIIREALSTEVPDIRPHRKSSFQVRKEKELAAKSKRILSTDPASTKIYAVRYADDMVGMYAGHEATGGNDPEVQFAARKAGVEIKPGSGKGRNFDVIGNKHSLAKFDQEYRAATRPIRDAITRDHGTHLERWRKVTAARDGAPGGNWREMESRQKKAWRSGKLTEVPPILLSNAYSEEELARVSPPDLKYAMKIKDA